MAVEKKDYANIGEPITVISEYGWGYRHIQTLLLFSIFSTAYVVRSSMSIAIIAMTDKTDNSTDFETFDWDKKTQDYILGAFYWGYVINQIPGAQLAHVYGGKFIIMLSLLANGLLLMVMPLVISMGGWKAACGMRMLQGLFQSPVMPAMNTILSKWAPLNERGRHSNFIIAGTPFGTIIGLPLVGYLSGHFGWPKAFQIVGAITILVTAIFFFFVADFPSQHRKISKEERNFIDASLGYEIGLKALKTPWKSIVTSRHVWVYTTAMTGINWCIVTMMLETPSFLNMALNISTENSGLYMMIPYMTMWVFGFICSIISDYIIKHKYASIPVVRKAASAIAAWGIAFGLIVLCFIPKEQVSLSILFLSISIGVLSASYVGYMLNPIELAPNFVGPIVGLGNCVSNVVGILAPITAGYLLEDASDTAQWRNVFLVTATVAICTNLVFMVFGVHDILPWNEPNKEDIEMKKEEVMCINSKEKTTTPE